MRTYCFTIDDNIRFLKEITEGAPSSLFHHPYTGMLRRLHERFGIKIQLNLFYRMAGFTLSEMTDHYKSEWQANADWLKLSFHSLEEVASPYLTASYDEVFADCAAVHREILRFAGKASLAATTTVHCCHTTRAGVQALSNLGIRGLLGLFGTRTSYSLSDDVAEILRQGKTLSLEGITYGNLDLVINNLKRDEILPALAALLHHDEIHVMIHEQYFYTDYRAYQEDFEEKLAITFARLHDAGFKNLFFEEMI